MGRVLLFILVAGALLWAMRTLVRAGTPRVASAGLTATGARTLTRVVCWALLVNLAWVCALGVVTTDEGEAGQTAQMVVVGLLVVGTIPVLVLRRLGVPHTSKRHIRPEANTSNPRQPARKTAGLAARIRDFTSRPVQ